MAGVLLGGVAVKHQNPVILDSLRTLIASTCVCSCYCMRLGHIRLGNRFCEFLSFC